MKSEYHICWILTSAQTTISDVIRIAPSDFEPRKQSIHALEDNIHKKYADKVLQQVGLCICFWDLLKVSDGMISHGDGMVNINGGQMIKSCLQYTHLSQWLFA